MSMISSAYIFDWKLYEEKINGPDRDPEDVNDWTSALKGIRELYSENKYSYMPDWKQELIPLYIDDFETILEERDITNLDEVCRMHFLGILACCTEEGDFYESDWDLLKQPLRLEFGNDIGDDLILGYYWQGSAWDFPPDIINYQFGFLEGDRMKEYNEKVLGLSEERLVEQLGKIDPADTYGIPRDSLNSDDIEGAIEAFKKLKRNLSRAIEKDLALFYMLD